MAQHASVCFNSPTHHRLEIYRLLHRLGRLDALLSLHAVRVQYSSTVGSKHMVSPGAGQSGQPARPALHLGVHQVDNVVIAHKLIDAIAAQHHIAVLCI